MTGKEEVRRAAFAARALAHTGGQGAATDHLIAALAPYAGRVLAGYVPMRTEVDPLPAMAAHQGPVALPVVMAPATPLQFREWRPDVPLVRATFGTMVPEAGAWLVPQVLIVPMLAFDARGFRLGYGGGFYDRTLEGLRAQGPVLALGFAFDAQEVPEVPTEPTDEPLDGIVTESGLRMFRARNIFPPSA